MDAVLTVFWGIVILCVIILVHEGGHFLAARLFHVRVTEFMLGLPGPRIGFKRKRSDTRFGITAIPLGGYARIAGMDEHIDETNLPQAVTLLYERGTIHSSELDALSEQSGFDVDEALEILDGWGTAIKKKLGKGEYRYDAPQMGAFELGQRRGITNAEGFIATERKKTYLAQPWWKKVCILLAGSVANILFAMIVFVVLLSCVGVSQGSLTISEAIENGPAYEAGIRDGDTILAVDGVEVETWNDFAAAIEGCEVGETVSITYEHDGKANEVSLATKADESGRAIIGVRSGIESVRFTIGEAFDYTFDYMWAVTKAIAKLLNPMTTTEVLSQSTSIIGISVAAKRAAGFGWFNFLWLTAAVSLSIGLMNLLPFLPLDGGHIIVQTGQRITGKLAPVRLLNAYTMFGLAFVLIIFVFAMKQDITSLITGVWPW